jgi:hypothetical protein
MTTTSPPNVPLMTYGTALITQSQGREIPDFD